MASIIKRKKKYSVVYSYFDENGKKHQKSETFDNNAEAKKRKAEIECEQENGTFTIPTAKTVNDLLDEYFAIYGVNNWAMSTYESRRKGPKSAESKRPFKKVIPFLFFAPILDVADASKS